MLIADSAADADDKRTIIITSVKGEFNSRYCYWNHANDWCLLMIALMMWRWRGWLQYLVSARNWAKSGGRARSLSPLVTKLVVSSNSGDSGAILPLYCFIVWCLWWDGDVICTRKSLCGYKFINFAKSKRNEKAWYFIKDGHNVLSPNSQLGQLDVSDVCWTVELQTWSDKIRGAAAASRALRSSFLSGSRGGGGAQQLARTKNFVASTLVIRNAADH